MNNSIMMATVKINAGQIETSAIFQMTFRQAPLKGEKYDAEKSEIYETLEFDTTELPPEIFVDCKAAWHGLKQKMIDNLAMSGETKAVTSLTEAITSTNDLWTQLKESWNAKAKAGKESEAVVVGRKMMIAVTAGIMPYETANDLYKSIYKIELAR